MIIGGFQKLSLIDYPGKIASIIFTKGCLFRCPYCHNPELVEYKDPAGIDERHVFDHLEKRRGFIEGVCITGGEPTLHKDLPDLISRVKTLGYDVKLDTNGVTPSMVKELIERKLVDYIAMDIKHSWDKYGIIARVAPGKEKFLDRCRETFSIIQDSGIPHEWRTTVLPGIHEEKDFLKMAECFKDGEKYFLQDISYKKNLDPSLPRTKKIDVKNIASLIRERFPKIAVETR